MDFYKSPRSTLIITVLLLLLSACGPSVAELQNMGDVEQLLELYHKQKPKEREDTEQTLRDLSAQAINELTQDAMGVCSGNAMAGAGTYVPVSSGPKPMLFVNANMGDTYFENTIFKTLNRLPMDWLPYKRGDLQAVVCMRIDRTLMQTCSYVSGASFTVKRWKATVDVTVREAATGAVIGSLAFDGDDPGPCPKSVTVSKPGSDNYDSSERSIIAPIVENLAQLGFDINN